MTDEYGAENQPPQEEHPAEHDPAAAHADPSAYTDQPPVDDFADSEPHSEEATTSTEEAEVTEETQAAEAPRSKSMLILLGVAGIVVLGGLAYWNFGRSSAPAPAMVETQQPAKKSASATGSEPSSSSTNMSENDINALYKAASPSSTLPPGDTAPKTAMVMAPEIPASGNAPHAPSMPAAAPVNNAAPPPAAALVSAAPAATGNEATDTRLNAMAAQINSLQKSLDDANKQLSQVANMAAANATTSPASQPSPAVEQRLNKLEQNLMQLQHTKKSSASAPSAPMPAESNSATAMADMSASEEATPAVSENKPAPTHKKHVEKHKPVHKKSAVTMVHKKATASATGAKVSSRWVLRAAVPNEAWVSANVSSPDLQHVQVGDQLPGVGHIKAINKTASGWEIEGSEATIR